MSANMRFRILLPILMLALSVSMFRLGEAQMTKLVQEEISHSRYGVAEHPLPACYALGRYMDYGRNAPAWLLSFEMPSLLPASLDSSCCGFIRGEKDWEYFLLVAAMWCGIGAWLDKHRIVAQGGKPEGPKWVSFTLRGVCGLYGAALWYEAVVLYPEPGLCWLPHSMALWGTSLIFVSLYPYSSDRRRAWHLVFGTLIAVWGLLDLYLAVRLWRYRDAFSIWSVAMFCGWGVALLVVSLYLFTRSRGRASLSAS